MDTEVDPLDPEIDNESESDESDDFDSPLTNIHPWSMSTPSPLVTLPPELLMCTFLIIVRATKLHKRWKMSTRLASVCRYWRDVALQVPTLWNSVTIDNHTSRRDPAMIQTLLARSKNTPLHLRISWIDGCEVETDPMTIIPELHRVENFEVFIYSGLETDPPPGSFNMPMLQRLYASGHDDSTIPILSPDFLLPHLKDMQVESIPFEEFVSFFRPTLVHLRIDSDAILDTIDTEGLLHALGDMPLLETLHITSLLQPLPDNQLPHVTLPFLKSSELSDNLIACADLLDHLTLPAAAFACDNQLGMPVVGVASEDLEPDLIRTNHLPRFLQTLSSKLSGNGVIPPFPSTIKLILNLNYEETTSSISAYDSLQATVPIFRFTIESTKVVACDFFDNIRSFVSASILAGIQELHILDQDADADNTPSGSLLALVSMLTNLESLHLSLLRGPEDALATAHRAIANNASGGNIIHLLPLPRLRTLSLTRLACPADPAAHEDDTQDAIWKLRDMLQIRNEAGMRLQELEIVHGTNVRMSDKELLEGLVDQLVWIQTGCV
ncbi:hypothetical protein BXZ70DRAFT_84501 [Cristinia sonorae]|uniref:F-box domain-containing protein n=1 Tax=Cristinia sonorae TaxID=1940300 RepID=A0A8K0URP1_9AGAR|nr:hypothetical protein BXZ70DRAFT_84501 [Cristinia sonorae]